MQRISGVARRYAKALKNVAGADLAKARQLATQLKPVQELFQVDAAAKVLNSPVMPLDLKRQLLDYALGLQQTEQVLKDFIKSVVEAGRVSELQQIIVAFNALLNEAEGVVSAKVTTSVALNDEVRTQIAAALAPGRKVDLTTEVDETLIGGMVVEIGHKILDLSIRSKLDRIANSVLV